MATVPQARILLMLAMLDDPAQAQARAATLKTDADWEAFAAELGDMPDLPELSGNDTDTGDESDSTEGEK